MAINKIKDSNGVEHELQTTIANVDGLPALLEDIGGTVQSLQDGRFDFSRYNFMAQQDSPNLSYYAVDNGTTSAGVWLGKNDNVTALFDGLSVKYKITKAGASTTTFNLNGLGAKTVYLRGTTKLTTHYAVDTMIHLIYSSSKGAWYVADYDTNSDSKLYQYYTLTQSDGEYPIIYSYTTDTGTTSYKSTYGAVKSDFTFNPANSTLTVPTLSATSVITGDIRADGELFLYTDDDDSAYIEMYGSAQERDSSINFYATNINFNGNVTVNGEPIGGGGGESTLYRHNIEIAVTINGKMHVGGISVYDTRAEKHTATTLFNMYNGHTFEFSGFYGNQGGSYTFIGSITITGNGSGQANGIWKQGTTSSVYTMQAMTFTVNPENTIVTPVLEEIGGGGSGRGGNIIQYNGSAMIDGNGQDAFYLFNDFQEQTDFVGEVELWITNGDTSDVSNIDLYSSNGEPLAGIMQMDDEYCAYLKISFLDDFIMVHGQDTSGMGYTHGISTPIEKPELRDRGFYITVSNPGSGAVNILRRVVEYT